MEAAKVMIVDKDINYLNSLFGEVRRHPLLEVVSMATTREQALIELKHKTIDLILMDIDLDEMGQDEGIQTIVDIRELNPTTKIIILSAFNSDGCIEESIFAGADGYILKSNIPKQIDEIENWMEEESPIEIIIDKFRKMQFELLKSKLTHAEKEVFDLLNTGLNQREISQRLFKSNATIKKQVKHILIKFEVSSTKELLKKLKRNIDWM